MASKSKQQRAVAAHRRTLTGSGKLVRSADGTRYAAKSVGQGRSVTSAGRRVVMRSSSASAITRPPG